MTWLNRNTSQRSAIKQFILSGNSITALEALSLFGAYRLAAHIEVLRNRDGIAIETTMNKDVTGRSYARYKLGTHSMAQASIVVAKAMAKTPVQGAFAYAH